MSANIGNQQKPCASEWRAGRGWSPRELSQQLSVLSTCPQTALPSDDEQADSDFRHYFSEATIARERPGEPLPGEAFEKARQMIERYTFSDPRIVIGHFDPSAPLLGRLMALEIKVLGLHYLCGVRVGAVRELRSTEHSVFGYRYDTLLGHIESGSEWFLLTKVHATGDIVFRIQAAWRAGQLPNWWTRLGFALLARLYQRAWHRLAYLRLRECLDASDLAPLPPPGQLLHEGRALHVPSIASVVLQRLPEISSEVQD